MLTLSIRFVEAADVLERAMAELGDGDPMLDASLRRSS